MLTLRSFFGQIRFGDRKDPFSERRQASHKAWPYNFKSERDPARNPSAELKLEEGAKTRGVEERRMN